MFCKLVPCTSLILTFLFVQSICALPVVATRKWIKPAVAINLGLLTNQSRCNMHGHSPMENWRRLNEFFRITIFDFREHYSLGIGYSYIIYTCE